MDGNARHRKWYAEMMPNEKAAFSRRRSEARLLKKQRNFSHSYTCSVPFGFVESGVCFSNASPEVATRVQDSQHEFPVANQHLQIELLASDNNQNLVVKHGLDYMSSGISRAVNPSGHALACPITLDLVQSGFALQGAHGTTARLPPIDEQVMSMKLVTLAKTTIEISKEKDPELFYLTQRGLGHLGIVAEVTLQCVEG